VEFTCTNNVTKFEALILGIENEFNVSCYHLYMFGDSELIENLGRIIYTPSKKFLKRYTHAVWQLISNLLSFNIPHIRRDLNSMDDMIVAFVASPTRKLLPERPDCTFMSLHHPDFLDNVES
jgi:hypothetical protein